MPEPDDTEPTALALALEDLKRNAAALTSRSLLDTSDVKKYLQDTLWPFLEALVEAIGEQFEQHGAAIDELIEGEDDLLHAELAGLIVGTLSQGGMIIRQLVAIIAKLNPQAVPVQLQQLIANHGKSIEEVIGRVSDVTVADDPDDGDEDDEGEDEEDDEEEEEDDDVDGR